MIDRHLVAVKAGQLPELDQEKIVPAGMRAENRALALRPGSS
jgi:hypothetical protein